MRRRSFAIATAGAVAGLAGCAGFLGDGSSTDRGPAETVRAFYEAAGSGDHEAANGYVHPDSPQGPVQREDAEDFAATDPAIEETEVLNRSEDVAEVRIVVSAESPNARGRETVETVFELRRSDGEWLLWDTGPGGGQAPAAPQVVWDVTEQRGDGVVTALEFLHNGGDAIEIQRLSIRAAGATAGPGDATGSLEAGDTITVAVDADGDPLAAGADVRVVWTSAESGSSSVIGQHTLTAGAAGGLADQFEA